MCQGDRVPLEAPATRQMAYREEPIFPEKDKSSGEMRSMTQWVDRVEFISWNPHTQWEERTCKLSSDPHRHLHQTYTPTFTHSA